MQGILSGPIALLGTSSRNGLLMEQNRINAAGGFLGRPIEFVFRDLKGQPQEAAHVARELVNSTGCELLIDAEASSASFAVQEVVRDLGGVACLHTTARPPRSAPHRLLCSASGRARRIAGTIHLAEYANAKNSTNGRLARRIMPTVATPRRSTRSSSSSSSPTSK